MDKTYIVEEINFCRDMCRKERKLSDKKTRRYVKDYVNRKNYAIRMLYEQPKKNEWHYYGTGSIDEFFDACDSVMK